MKRDKEITELKAIINANEKTINANEKTIKLQEERIQHYKDCNTDQTETMNRYANALGLDSRGGSPLRVV